MTPTVNRLQKRAQLEAPFDLRSEVERQALANLIVKAARTLKSPMDFVSYDHLKASWKAYRRSHNLFGGRRRIANKRRRAAGGSAVMCRLFVGVGERDQLRFASSPAQQLYPNPGSVPVTMIRS
jgi:hypothetical protein